MMGPTHRLLGALSGATVATWTGHSSAMVAMTALVSAATSHGWSSPDVDQTEGWRAAASALPGRLGVALAHRHLSHWWGLPVLAWFVVIKGLDNEARWPAIALLVGWSSHLLGDAVFGRLPLLPWGSPTFGMGLDTGGFIETGRARIFGRDRLLLPFGPTRLLLTIGLIWVAAGLPGLDTLSHLWDLTASTRAYGPVPR